MGVPGSPQRAIGSPGRFVSALAQGWKNAIWPGPKLLQTVFDAELLASRRAGSDEDGPPDSGRGIRAVSRKRQGSERATQPGRGVTPLHG